MRIAQVVTYISPDGAFGGPVTVARAQCAALAGLGHEVTLFAGAPVPRATVRVVDGYRERLFPARNLAKGLGFAGLRAPRLTAYLRAHASDFDVAHVHMARDLVTLPAAWTLERRGLPVVIQPHGMIDRSGRILAKLLDAVATARTLTRASTVLSLTPVEDAELTQVAPHAMTSRIVNGIALQDLPDYGDRRPEVLFLARLHPRKRALAFVEMAGLLGSRYPEIVFSLVGPDEGDGEAVRKAIAASGLSSLSWVGALPPSEAAVRLRSASVFVLPSSGEVFPMTMLEAFSAGTPTVCTDSLGIAEECRRYGAAIVTDGSVDQLADAVSSILDAPAIAGALRAGAQRYLRERLDIQQVAGSLEVIYADSLGATS